MSKRRKYPEEEDLFAQAPRTEPSPQEESQTPELDLHFCRLMHRLDGRNSREIETAAQMVSAWRSRGHTCVRLSEMGGDVAQLRRVLESSPIVGSPSEWKPLILDHDRLYLQRYWECEQRLAQAIRSRMAAGADHAFTRDDAERAEAILGTTASDQLRAVETALTQSFCIVTGGPGTGKTRTAAALLAVVYEKAAREGAPPPRVAMAAPTGKAAARLTESLRATLASMDAPPDLQALQAVTLHRLLGTRPDAPAARFNEARPLALDLVIVDEASMIDLLLMGKLFRAVPPSARLVLLGDRDQLASIEAGHVLGDLCAAADRGVLGGAVVELRHTFRFTEQSGIGALTSRLRAGDFAATFEVLQTASWPDLTPRELPGISELTNALAEKVVCGFRALTEASTPQQAVTALTRFSVLCAVRRGPFGVESLNRTIERLLADAQMIVPTAGQYPHRPIMILSNDYNLRLFNGDVGVVLQDPENEGELRAFFAGSDGELRRIHPARLPHHETVWAMTVHKSQGSEYDEVLVVLPDREGPILSRELLYTAVSRARRSVELWQRPQVLEFMVRRTVERASGLVEALADIQGNTLGSATASAYLSVSPP